MKKPRVLFLCTGNSARSQMAEAFLKKHGGERFEVHSAGLEPIHVHPFTIQVLEEAGIDTHGLHAKGLDTFFNKMHFGYLITVCAKAEEKCPTFPGMGMRLHWPFEDPAALQGTDEEKLKGFREVRDQIEAQVKAWLEEEK